MISHPNDEVSDESWLIQLSGQFLGVISGLSHCTHLGGTERELNGPISFPGRSAKNRLRIPPPEQDPIREVYKDKPDTTLLCLVVHQL